jgi:hypothetical protein
LDISKLFLAVQGKVYPPKFRIPCNVKWAYPQAWCAFRLELTTTLKIV